MGIWDMQVPAVPPSQTDDSSTPAALPATGVNVGEVPEVALELLETALELLLTALELLETALELLLTALELLETALELLLFTAAALDCAAWDVPLGFGS